MKLNLSIIKNLCRQKGVTIKEFSAQIGFSETGVSRAIKNNKTTSDFLEKASDYFECSMDTFFGVYNATEKGTIEGIVRKTLDMYEEEINKKCTFLSQLPTFVSNIEVSIIKNFVSECLKIPLVNLLYDLVLAFYEEIKEKHIICQYYDLGSGYKELVGLVSLCYVSFRWGEEHVIEEVLKNGNWLESVKREAFKLAIPEYLSMCLPLDNEVEKAIKELIKDEYQKYISEPFSKSDIKEMVEYCISLIKEL